MSVISFVLVRLSDRALEGDGEQLLRLDGELHRELRKTSLQKPLTIMFTASSAVRPRCRQ